MKLLVSLLVISFLSAGVYSFLSRRQPGKRAHWRAGVTAGVVALLLLGVLLYAMNRFATAPDTQCMTTHETTSQPPATLTTYKNYFALGNYEYDRGNCQQAIFDYTTAIDMYPIYRQAYNNRGYTHMRMHDYGSALSDFNQALYLNPYYIQALMNRGDMYNYYYNIDRKRAVEDYKTVVQLGATQSTSVCGHLFLAEHNGWNVGTVLDFPRAMLNMCR